VADYPVTLARDSNDTDALIYHSMLKPRLDDIGKATELLRRATTIGAKNH